MLAAWQLFSFAALICGSPGEADALRAILVDASPKNGLEQIGLDLRSRYRANALVVMLDDEMTESRRLAMISLAQKFALPVYGWIEVARNPRFAEAHPRWMASIGMHDDWRTRFPHTPKPARSQLVKAYPWVPIWYRPAFDAHVDRVRRILGQAPVELSGLFLNDIQAGPSSCGCGNDQCRWAVDYHVASTAEKLIDPATSLAFLNRVRTFAPRKNVIPVWCIECELVDQKDQKPTTGYCGGVNCFHGLCWKEYSKQLMPIADNGALAFLALHREFGRTNPAIYDKQSWLPFAVRTFHEMPPQHNGRSVAPEQLIAVLEGWRASPAEIDRQIDSALKLGLCGFVLAITPIEQSWQPRIVDAASP